MLGPRKYKGVRFHAQEEGPGAEEMEAGAWGGGRCLFQERQRASEHQASSQAQELGGQKWGSGGRRGPCPQGWGGLPLFTLEIGAKAAGAVGAGRCNLEQASGPYRGIGQGSAGGRLLGGAQGPGKLVPPGQEEVCDQSPVGAVRGARCMCARHRPCLHCPLVSSGHSRLATVLSLLHSEGRWCLWHHSMQVQGLGSGAQLLPRPTTVPSVRVTEHTRWSRSELGEGGPVSCLQPQGSPAEAALDSVAGRQPLLGSLDFPKIKGCGDRKCGSLSPP